MTQQDRHVKEKEIKKAIQILKKFVNEREQKRRAKAHKKASRKVVRPNSRSPKPELQFQMNDVPNSPPTPTKKNSKPSSRKSSSRKSPSRKSSSRKSSSRKSPSRKSSLRKSPNTSPDTSPIFKFSKNNSNFK